MPPAPTSTTSRAATRRCPVCDHEAWPTAYGMITPSMRESMPKSEFAGCVIDMAVRDNPATGREEIGTPKWACQNPECRHRWW
ncbi:hypothetical protein GCM10009825_18090 [Arthrobacter humicola]|uniref:Uncharacterized protein n=1 Tax=Arthrobacter humicola TaxID=409291 RepID=A0ABP5KM07_9MICC